VLAGELRFGTVMLFDHNALAGMQLSESVIGRDFVGFEKCRDAAGELFDDFVFAADHGFNIDFGVVSGNAVLAEQMLHIPVLA